MNELKLCPFCGGKAKFEPVGLLQKEYELESGFVACQSKKCGVVLYGESKIKAIKVWNRRIKG